MLQPDRIASYEARLEHYKNELEQYLNLSRQTRGFEGLAIQDSYFYGCTLVDLWLAHRGVVVDGDTARSELFASLSAQDSHCLAVSVALSKLDLLYRGGTGEDNAVSVLSLPKVLLELSLALSVTRSSA